MSILVLLFSLSVVIFANGQIEINKTLEEIQSSENQIPSNSSIDLESSLEENSEVKDSEVKETELNATNITNISQKNSLSLDPYEVGNNTKVDCKNECVPFYQCNNGTINTNGETLIDIRVKDGPCGNPFLTCCKLEDLKANYSTSAPIEDVPVGCGYRNPDGVDFTITGGKDGEAQFAEFPWMVSILKDLGAQSTTRPSCGGALIHPQAVITAAHCVSNKNERWTVRLGEWDINGSVEPYPYQEVSVESIATHKQFYSGALFNDIAFLYLKTPVTLTKTVNTICLPPPGYEHKSNNCFSTGWGKDKFGQAGKYHNILKKVELPFVNRSICQEKLRKTRLGSAFILHKSFMCAGGEKGKDACKGDGGSPLVCPLEQEGWRYYQAGIVAWGIGCGEENIPGVYVDIAQFREWIDEQMEAHNLETKFYDQNIGLEPRIKEKNETNDPNPNPNVVV